MEYRKNCSSPRDMVDEELLARLLGENNASEMSEMQYSRRSSRTSNTCGCRSRNNRPTPYQMSRQEENTQINTDRDDSDCGCDDNESCAVQNALSGYHLAMAFVPDHEWHKLHAVEDALGRGTLFSELDFPFQPACCSSRSGEHMK